MTQSTRVHQTIPLPQGKTSPLLRVETPTTSTWEITFSLDADSVLFSLYVGSLSSGSLSVTAYTVADVGQEIQIVSFPTITGPTANLLLRKAAVSLSNVRVSVVSTGPVTLDLRARGISSGETSVKIDSAGSITTNQLTVGTTPLSLFASALTDRNGVVIRNWGNVTLYIAETSAKATPALGYPIGGQESLGIDIQAGQVIYGAVASGSTDVRTMEAGEL